MATTISPADLNGTAALTWRYRDSEKRDSSWAYVPALRRVRAVSPANRSDGFLGSDMSQDDGQFFDGKPEDFTWTLKGDSDQLRFVDPLSFYLLNQIGYPVVFDAGHSIRKYGIPSKDPRGSARQFLTTLARSAVAAGVDGFFIESHPNPPEALCDAASQYALDDLESFMRPLIEIHNLVRSQAVH